MDDIRRKNGGTMIDWLVEKISREIFDGPDKELSCVVYLNTQFINSFLDPLHI